MSGNVVLIPSPSPEMSNMSYLNNSLLMASLSSSPMPVEENDALDILRSYYDEFSLLRVFGFFGGIFLSFIVAWAVPTLFQTLFRDKWGLEINFNSKVYRKMLRNYKGQRKEIDKNMASSDRYTKYRQTIQIYVPDEYEKQNSIKLFMRTNLFVIFYLLLRLSILMVGSFLSFLIIKQDFIAVVTSFGFGGLVALVQLSVYFSNLFAHFWIIITSKVNMGDIITFPNGISGMIVEMGAITTTLITINPNYIPPEENEEEIIDMEVNQKLYTPPPSKMEMAKRNKNLSPSPPSSQKAITYSTPSFTSAKINNNNTPAPMVVKKTNNRSISDDDVPWSVIGEDYNKKKNKGEIVTYSSSHGVMPRTRDDLAMTASHHHNHHSHHHNPHDPYSTIGYSMPGSFIPPSATSSASSAMDNYIFMQHLGLTQKNNGNGYGKRQNEEVFNPSDMPWHGRYFKTHPMEGHHVAFAGDEFIELQVPNYDLNHSIIYVKRA